MLRKFYTFLILLYALLLLYLMLLGFGREQFSQHIVRFAPIASTFYFVQNTTHWQDIFINLIGNIVLFMPFGFLGWVKPKWNDFQTLLFDFLTAIIIVESLQYFSKMGVFDIDDLFFNAFGLWLGYQIYLKINSLLK
ncbi:MAG: VanZ family protein [Flavobacteriaceae bacterium]|nr:VanZ family protein [Flavobacteriaceae bacterium]